MATDEKIYDFFISYRREKKADKNNQISGNSQTEVIYCALQKIDKDFYIFQDTKSMTAGLFPETIENAIKRSRRFIFLINEDSWREVEDNKRDFYYLEIGWAWKYVGKENMLPIVSDHNAYRMIRTGLPESVQKYFREKSGIDNLKSVLGDLEYLTYYPDSDKLAAGIRQKFTKPGDCINVEACKYLFDSGMSNNGQKKNLLGRVGYAESLYKAFFEERKPIVNIVAMGGMGKTAFAHIYKTIYGGKYKNIHHIYINNDDLYGSFIDKMQLLINDAQFNRDLETFKTDESKTFKILDELSQFPGGPYLLVIDINNVSNGMTNFFNGLTSKLSGKWHVLVLSRISFDALEDYRFSRFDGLADEPQTAVDIFREISGIKDTDCSDNELCEVFSRAGFNYIPILVESLAAHCHRVNKIWNYRSICEAIDLSEYQQTPIKYNTELRHDAEIKNVFHYLQKLISIEDFDYSCQKIMHHFVLWNSEFVPEEIVKTLLSAYNLNDLHTALDELVSNMILETTTKAYIQGVPLESLTGVQIGSMHFEELMETYPMINIKKGYRMNQLLTEILYEQVTNKPDIDYAPYLATIRKELKIQHISRFQEMSSFIISSLLKDELINDCDDLIVSAASHYYYILNERSDKHRILEMAIKVAEQIKIKQTDSFEKLERLSTSLHDIANVLINQQRPQNAEIIFEKSLEIRSYMQQRLIRKTKESIQTIKCLVLECYCLCLLNKGNDNAIKKYLQKGLKAMEGLQDPTLYILQYHLYRVSDKIGDNKQKYIDRTKELEKISMSSIQYANCPYKPIPELLSLAGGRFNMGDSSIDTNSNGKPVHEVSLSSYKISKYPITQFQWDWVMNDIAPSVHRCDLQRGLGPDYPMYNITWYEAALFCNRLGKQQGLEEVYSLKYDDYNRITNVMILNGRRGYRLPTEAEWEFAARSGYSVNKYTGTEDDTKLNNTIWYEGNSNATTHQVGKLKPNNTTSAIYDMSGNIGEWCQDWYGDYTPETVENPMGPHTGEFRVVRGGGWGSIASECRVSNRNANMPEDRRGSIGFRIVLKATN